MADGEPEMTERQNKGFKTIVVNCVAGPGAGKSTLAAATYSQDGGDSQYMVEAEQSIETIGCKKYIHTLLT